MTDLPDAYFEMRSFVKIVKRYDNLSSIKYFLNIYILWLATNNISCKTGLYKEMFS